MQCNECGTNLHDNETICPNCHTAVYVEVKTDNTSVKYEEYKVEEQLMEQYGTKNLLIFSIIELVCCNQLFGIAGLLILELKLKRAIREKRFEDANKDKKLVELVLILGIVFGILLQVFDFGINILAMIYG